MNVPLLRLQSLSASLAGSRVLDDISFQVESGEFFSLLGPSGCGKTTLLRIIAGFLAPTEGNLFWLNKDVTRSSPQCRDLNLVFQNYALFPHLNVFENVAFGLRMQKKSEGEIRDRVMDALGLVRMSAHAKRAVQELSGGQQQRIALARAVAPRPSLVLLDEPLGALDLQLRKEMQWELKSLQRQLGMTFLYVTHDQEEAFAMSDRIAILNGGRIEQVASPENLYTHPASRFVARFIGTANFIPVQRLSESRARFSGHAAECDLHITPPMEGMTDHSGDVLARPEHFSFQITSADASTLEGRVEKRQFLGANVRYQIALQCDPPCVVTVDQPSVGAPPWSEGQQVSLRVTPPRLHYFPGNPA
jgi:spermidine/putrescine transport system ATP-binding protein